MLPSRFAPAQSSAQRKPRFEGKPSMLPKPRRPGSSDRLSAEARRPSTTSLRSNSAEPPRATIGGGRLSREASATKLPLNRRSRSQQSESRFAQSSMTPLRSSQYLRATTTPVRTPSEDRSTRNWQNSLERALAFVTVRDQRPISSAAWQRAEFNRVQQALAASNETVTLIRPLTIARFVEIVATLLHAITNDAKLNNDNYVAKLPNVAKRLLYPGTVSKSWLKTVNTLHAFPQALAFIAYLLDLANRINTVPVCEEALYVCKDEVACLRRDYLRKCFIRFQEPDSTFLDLNEEYLQNLKKILGNDDDKIEELNRIIKQYEQCLEDAGEAAARADEERREARRDSLCSAVRSERAARAGTATELGRTTALLRDDTLALTQLQHEIDRSIAESEQLCREVEEQPMSVAERMRLLDEVDYAHRVHDSKEALAEQIAKSILSKETELTKWQKQTLDSCMVYKEQLIHLSAEFPELAPLAVDENELMEPACGLRMAAALESLRALTHRLAERRADRVRARTADSRRRAQLLEETRAAIAEAKCAVSREQQELAQESAHEAAESTAWASEQREAATRTDQLAAQLRQHAAALSDLAAAEQHDHTWRIKLSQMQEYVEEKKAEKRRLLEDAKAKRVKLITDMINQWNKKIEV